MNGLMEAAAGVDPAQLMKPGEVADLLGIGRTKVYEMMAAGELPVTRIGTAVRVQRGALLRWIAERTTDNNN
jgi:excisionase family DNA binding protein